MITRPILAATLNDKAKITFPGLVSPKFDGIRCLIIDGVALSRSFKPIRNKHIQAKLSSLPSGLDGEIIIPREGFNSIQSKVMRIGGKPAFEFHVFDYVATSLTEPFTERYSRLQKLDLPESVKIVPHYRVNSRSDIAKYYAQFLKDGFEGLMFRAANSAYKLGRVTQREGWLLKMKPFQDDEGIIVGFEELQHNHNIAEKNELGLSSRSTKKSGREPAETLGKFIVQWKGLELKIGTGQDLTKDLRKQVWDNKNQYLGKLLKFRYQKHGMKDKPRIPIFVGFRHEEDR